MVELFGYFRLMAKKTKTAHFGEHITIDGYGGDPKLLTAKRLFFLILTDLVKKLG